MSPLWRDHLFVALAPERLTALRVGGRWRPGGRRRHEQALPAANLVNAANATNTADATNTAQGTHWETLATALELFLEQPDWRTQDLTLILSSHYVHYAVLPAGKGLTATAQNDLARLIFRNVFGELSHDWEIRVSPAGDLPTLASAIPQPFLKALRDACDGRTRLRSIQPGLMTVFNRARRSIGQATGLLTLVEPGRISLASIKGGQWQSVVSRAGASTTLPQLLADESDLHGREPGGMLWLCDLTGQVQLPAGPPWHLQRLHSPGSAAGAVSSLADWGPE